MKKFFMLSKTFQGVFVMAVPTLATLIGWDFWNAEDTANASSVVDNAVQAIGGAWALYGRINAEGDITVSPKKE